MLERDSYTEGYYEVYPIDPPTTEVLETEDPTVAKVAEKIQAFLGMPEFGAAEPDKDPFYIRSIAFAKSLIPRVKQSLYHLPAAISDEEKAARILETRDVVAAELIKYSGLPDQDKDEDFTKDPLYKRSLERAPEIIKIIAVSSVGLAAAGGLISYVKNQQKHI